MGIRFRGRAEPAEKIVPAFLKMREITSFSLAMFLGFFEKSLATLRSILVEDIYERYETTSI